MATGNAIQTATVVSGGSSSSGTSTVTIALLDATGTVNVSNATAPSAAGSVLTSSDTTDAIWSTTTGTVGSAGFATNSGTASTSVFATNAGTATTSGFATNAGTATTSGFATNAGTATTSGFATNAGTATTSGFATNSGTATLANALGDSGPGTVNVGGQAAPGAAGSVLTVTQVTAGGTLASWSTTAGTVGSASFATNSGTATTSSFATNAGTATIAGNSVPYGGAAGTLTAIATAYHAAAASTQALGSGAAVTVAANYIGTGTAYTGVALFLATGTMTAASSTVLVYANLYWNSTLLATVPVVAEGGTNFIGVYAGVVAGYANGPFPVYANVYWQSNSVANVTLTTPVQVTATSTMVTGLTTTLSGSLWWQGTMSIQGTATATVQMFQSQIYQVH